jgi:hypothetical protein
MFGRSATRPKNSPSIASIAVRVVLISALQDFDLCNAIANLVSRQPRHSSTHLNGLPRWALTYKN